jgi:hypothetical protein
MGLSRSEHGGVPPHGTKRIGILGNDGRGGVSRKYWEVSERRKRAILLQTHKRNASM